MIFEIGKNVKIVAYYLTLNEEEYLPVSLESVIDDVDKVLILDGGSEDNTHEIAKSICGDKLIWEEIKQEGDRYGDGWNQPQRRNHCLDVIDSLEGDWWVLEMGADAIVDDKLWLYTSKLRNEEPKILVMPTYNFWGNMQYYIKGKNEHIIRGFHYHDPHPCIWKSNIGIRHDEKQHHSLQMYPYKGKMINACNTPISMWINAFMFHLHRGWGSRIDDCKEDRGTNYIQSVVGHDQFELLKFIGKYPEVIIKRCMAC